MISAARLRWRCFLTLMGCNGTNVLQNFPAWIHTKHLHSGRRILCIIWPVEGQGRVGVGVVVGGGQKCSCSSSYNYNSSSSYSSFFCFYLRPERCVWRCVWTCSGGSSLPSGCRTPDYQPWILRLATSSSCWLRLKLTSSKYESNKSQVFIGA